MAECAFEGEVQALCEALAEELPKASDIVLAWIGVGTAFVLLVGLGWVFIHLRGLPKRLGGLDFDEVSFGAAGVSLELKKVTKAASDTVGQLSKELLELHAYVDELHGGQFYDGEHFAPPSPREMKLAQARQMLLGHRVIDRKMAEILSFGEDERDKREALWVAARDEVVEDLPDHPYAAGSTLAEAELPLNILWVDDRSTLVAFERQYLRSRGHNITEFTASAEAIKALSERIFHVVISDTHRDGNHNAWREVYDVLKPGQPFVVFSTPDKIGGVNEWLEGNTSAFASASFGQLRWRLLWLQRELQKQRDRQAKK